MHSEPTTTDRTARDERIRDLYVNRRFTDREIGQALGLHRVTVTRIRIRLGISRDDRTVAA